MQRDFCGPGGCRPTLLRSRFTSHEGKEVRGHSLCRQEVSRPPRMLPLAFASECGLVLRAGKGSSVRVLFRPSTGTCITHDYYLHQSWSLIRVDFFGDVRRVTSGRGPGEKRKASSFRTNFDPRMMTSAYQYLFTANSERLPGLNKRPCESKLRTLL